MTIRSENQVLFEGVRIIDILSEIKEIRDYQLAGHSLENATKLYNLTKVYLKKISGGSVEDDAMLSTIRTMPDIFSSLKDVDKFLNSISQNIKIEPTIPEIKKRIKYCRNPMEKKKLQQELNMAYKEQKKRR